MPTTCQASYPSAWDGYQACASYDGLDWFRIPSTTFNQETGVLSISHTPDHDVVHYAYFAPYPMQRHEQLVHSMQMHSHIKLQVLGQTIDGRNMDMLQVGEDEADQPRKKRVWLAARQHPGETQAEWFMEGLLNRLADTHDPVTKAALKSCVFFCIPNMCPDGSARGHLRTNAAGVNLNRVWKVNDPQTSPEVYYTLQAMAAEGVDFMLDVHGDEELPYCFVAGLDGIPAWGPRLQGLQSAFCTSFTQHSPDFQIGERFGALSLTLEMPFKDNCELPDARVGWSPRRSMLLGAAVLGATLDVAPTLGR
ncbi:peptidase M14, carboxypeptidase A [Dunaliella salina]|uniref:Peptidase M14, carboxypeptidase A n=1 Tax=Dunaliella salina TaxID=3046 RepID=A0ABZ3L1G5_DUNSA|nr:peptidase M14, carboxypeptidase A [Dunaliella salina]|eukprot:KAF5835263.1 peptidase M14, carboxypeptidase A [Dunaliella salina]